MSTTRYAEGSSMREARALYFAVNNFDDKACAAADARSRSRSCITS